MIMTDLYFPYNHLFNQAAKRAFKNLCTQVTLPPRKLKSPTGLITEVQDEIRFFGSFTKGGERGLFDAAQRVANRINHLSDKGFVTGALIKLTCVQFATEPHEIEKYAVISYVALSPAGLEYIKTFKDQSTDDFKISEPVLDFEGSKPTTV